MQQAIQFIKKELTGLYPETEIGSFIHLILQKITGYTKTELIVNKNTIFSESQVRELSTFVQKLKEYEPIQYILGSTEFYGLEFEVNSSVLIPRPETEELVEWIGQCHPGESQIQLLDIGSGSGCIAIALKHIFPNSEVTGYDISLGALQTAECNAARNKAKVLFVQKDILNEQPEANRWDVVVSNPPYIPEAEKAEILPNVLNYEPHTALFVPDHDPLLFYRTIAHYAWVSLKPGGQLFFEIHCNYGNACVQLLTEMGYERVELKKDLSGKDRMIKAEKI